MCPYAKTCGSASCERCGLVSFDDDGLDITDYELDADFDDRDGK